MSKPVWNEASIIAAKRYNALQFSRSQIADLIFEHTGQRFSRNAVIGKLARLGVKCQKPTSQRKNSYVNSARPPRVRGRNAQRINAKREDAGPPTIVDGKGFDFSVLLGAPEPRHIPYADQRDGECKYFCSPEGAPITVCGHQQLMLIRLGRREPSSYCPFHHNFTHAGFAWCRAKIQGTAA